MLDKVLQNAPAVLLLFWAVLGGVGFIAVVGAGLLGRLLDQQTFGLVSNVIATSIGGIGTAGTVAVAARTYIARNTNAQTSSQTGEEKF